MRSFAGHTGPIKAVAITPDGRRAVSASSDRTLRVWDFETGMELLSFSDDGAYIRAQLRSADGRQQSCEAAYLAGCDGARSIVRESLGTGFPGGTYRQIFYVADIDGAGAPVNGELHVDLDEADFLALFPLAGAGRARLIGTVRDERADHRCPTTFVSGTGR